MREDNTGERFLPGKCGGEIAIEHYQRYRFAMQMVKGKKVLDAACGEGYGSQLLAREADRVTGLDLNEKVVEQARQKYGNDRLLFRVGSIEALPFEDQCFDVVVSCETIEHVEEEIQNRFLKEIRRVLKRDGILIMSTPNKAVYTDLVKGQNRFHVKEFYVTEYREFLHRYFDKIELFCQYPDLGYFISREGEKIPVYDKEGKSPEKSRYVIAVCRDSGQIRQINTEGLTVFEDYMYYDLNRAVHEKEQEIRNLKTEAEAFQRQLEQGICEQKEYIEKLERDLFAAKEAYEGLSMMLKHPLRYLMKRMKRVK